MKHKGIICGILAAVCYGTNPLGALPLYEEGVNTSSVLFLRFSIATLILGVVMIANRKSFAVTRGELTTMASLGALMAVSSLTYYQSFRYSHHHHIYCPCPGWYRTAIPRRCRHLAEHDGRDAGDGVVAHLCCVHRYCQPVRDTHVDSETHFLCVADMRHVPICLFLYLFRPAPDAAPIATGMVLCLLVRVGANGTVAVVHDHRRA